jgi:hypothetical protein
MNKEDSKCEEEERHSCLLVGLWGIVIGLWCGYLLHELVIC